MFCIHRKYVSLFIATILTAGLAACGGGGGDGSGDNTNPDNIVTNLQPLSCTGNRVWDGGESDVIEGATSLISESDGFQFTSSRFPCAAFWEFHPTENCSLVFNYEDYLAEFNQEDIFQTIGTSGANLFVNANNGVQVSGTPANVSLEDLNQLPDCSLL